MKTRNYIKSLLLLAVAGGLFTSCDPDAEDWSAGQQAPAGATHVYIADALTNTIEKDPADAKTFDINLERPASESKAAQAVKIEVVKNDSNVFTVPDTAYFAAGDSTTSVTVTAANYVEGNAYSLEVKLAGSTVDPYTAEKAAASYTFSVIKWENVGQGYLYENTITTFFGAKPTLLQLKDIQRSKTTSDVRYRFTAPFCAEATDQDENGAFDYYPFNQATDITGTHKWVLKVTSKGVTYMGRQYYGMDWGYGEFYLISQGYGKISKDVITFPANSLAIFMAKHGGALVKSPNYIFLSKDAYTAFVKANAGSKAYGLAVNKADKKLK